MKKRMIDAEELYRRMYDEAFEKDSDLQKWDSGCWIRFKLFENVFNSMPIIEIETEDSDIDYSKTGKLLKIVEEAKAEVENEKVGHWIKIDSDIYECSECHNGTSVFVGEDYCPHCGVKMQKIKK